MDFGISFLQRRGFDLQVVHGTSALVARRAVVDVADRLEQAFMVEPVDPAKGRKLDGLESLPGAFASDQLGLTERLPVPNFPRL